MAPTLSALYALYSDVVAVMAPEPALWWMQDWLADARFQPDSRLMSFGQEDVEEETHPAMLADGVVPDRMRHSTLITWFPTSAETFAAVTPKLLEEMGHNPLWVQCGPMDTSAALGAAELARRAGVTYCHAPLRVSPGTGRRGPCRIYEPERPAGMGYLANPTGRHRISSVMEALSSVKSEMGSLFFRRDGEHDLGEEPS